MKAVVFREAGGPEALSIEEMPNPLPAAGEILIDVRYSGINYAETLVRRGIFPVPAGPTIMGLEVVGTVAAVGRDVDDFRIGQPVTAFTRSGYAQRTTVAASLAIALDEPGREVCLEQAIGVPCTGVTAHQLLTLVGRLVQGDAIFVQGASGGVGTMLGQQAKALGAGRVIGSVGSAAKVDFALSHGYDDVILRDDFATELGTLTEGRGVDLFFEGISGANLATPERFLTPLGRAVFFGDVNFSTDTSVGISQLRSGSWTVSGYSLGGLCVAAPEKWRPSAAAVLSMINSGSVQGGRTTMLSPHEAGQAHHLLESRQAQGKLGLDWSLL